MRYPYFDVNTFFIYFFFGCLCVLSIHIVRGGKYSKNNEIKGFWLLFTSLFVFAVFRKIGLGIGGTDAIGYQDFFINYFNRGAERFEDTDVLFGVWMAVIRYFTDNPYIYRTFCYGLIILGYIVCIKHLCPQNISPIPFVCILVPYMKSLNTMRSSMSIALVLFSLVCYYEKKYIWCIIWSIAAVFMHRLSFAMFSVFSFIYWTQRYLISISKVRLIIFTSILVIVSFLLSKLLQQYVILFSLFADNGNADLWYLTHNEGNNILLNWPMYLPHLILFLALLIKYNQIKSKNNPQITFLLTLFYFDIIIMPATLVLGLWRFAEYLYIPNLILWAYLIPMYYSKQKTNLGILVRPVFFLGFTGLMLIRLAREWEDAALMPYLFFWE